MRLFCQFASVNVNPKQNSLRKCGCRILLQITLLFASSLERQTGLESKGKDVQVNNRHFTKLCCGAFSVPDHLGTLRPSRNLDWKWREDWNYWIFHREIDVACRLNASGSFCTIGSYTLVIDSRLCQEYFYSYKCVVVEILGIENSFELIFHLDLLGFSRWGQGKNWSDSNKYTSYASDEEKRQLSWRIMLHFGVNRVIGKSLHITSMSGTLWWIETILGGQMDKEIGVFCTTSQCSNPFRILNRKSSTASESHLRAQGFSYTLYWTSELIRIMDG